MSIGEQIIQAIIGSFFSVVEFATTEVIGSLLTALFNAISGLFGTTT